jgi:hypothetical protein
VGGGRPIEAGRTMWAERGESAAGKRKRKGLLADFSFLSLLSKLTQLYLNSNEI